LLAVVDLLLPSPYNRLPHASHPVFFPGRSRMAPHISLSSFLSSFPSNCPSHSSLPLPSSSPTTRRPAPYGTPCGAPCGIALRYLPAVSPCGIALRYRPAVSPCGTTLQFGDSVLDMGWPDHHSPPLTVTWRACNMMSAWLLSSPDNVVVVHCNAGKGRTG
jgi:hypothetical protein